MRQIIKNISFGILALMLLMVVSCEYDEINRDWTEPLVYMPQTTLFSGGSDNNFPVPMNNNFSMDSANNKINVTLGVFRSGTQKPETFSVDVSVDNDTITSLINSGKIQNGVLLTPDMYTLPDHIEVSKGELSTSFSLALDMTKVADYYGKTLALAVRISNPSRYKLNEAKSTTIVLFSYKNLYAVLTNAFISIPQASEFFGNESNDYPVPTDNNFVTDEPNNKIKIPLEIFRSGNVAAQSFSVDVSVDNDLINTMISSGKIQNGVLLTPDMYTLPSTIDVPSGAAEAEFSLDLDRTKVADYYGNILALAIRLDNPTRFRLHETKSTIIILFDYRKYERINGTEPVYTIKMSYNNNVLAIDNNTNADGAELEQQVRNTQNDYQVWKRVKVSTNVYQFINVGSAKALDVTDLPLDKFNWNGNWHGTAQRPIDISRKTQHWKIQASGDKFTIINVGLTEANPGKNIGFNGWNWDDFTGATNIALYNVVGDGNELFYVNEVE